MAKNRKRNRGITLISLIVIIVILLILSSITLTTLTGDESILIHAQNAKDATELNDNREQGVLKNIIEIGSEGITGGSSSGNGSGEGGSGSGSDQTPVEPETPATGTKLAEVASIGDIVNYDPTTGGNVNSTNTTYTSVAGSTTAHGNGSGSQTFSASNYKNAGGKWRILNIEDDTVTLISDKLIYQDSGTTMGTTGFTLTNGIGYLWAEEELHRIGAIYGHGDGADLTQTVKYYYGGPNDQDGSIDSANVAEAQQGRKTTLSLDTPSGARALTVEDVNKICEAKDSNGNLYTADWHNGTPVTKVSNNAKNYPTLNGTSSTGQSSAVSSPSGSYYVTYYKYSISSANTDTTAQTNQNTMLKPGKYYWLASRSVGTDSSYAYFNVRYVNSSGSVDSYYACSCTSGGWSTFTPSYGVRPVITLKSGIQTSDTEYDGDTGWNLVK